MIVFVWCIDVGDFVGVLFLVDYVIWYKLVMFDQYQCIIVCFIVEEFVNMVLKDLVVIQLVDVEVFIEVEVFVCDQDMFDEVCVKLYKVLGYVIVVVVIGYDQVMVNVCCEEVFVYLCCVLELYDKFGVKKDIECIECDIKNVVKFGDGKS